MAYILDEKTGRRKFLKSFGLTAAAATAVGGLSGCSQSFGSKEHEMSIDAEALKTWNRNAGEWIPSCCNMCGGQSGILVHVVNGIVEKIEPNHWNPTNYSNISTDFFDGYTEEFGCAEGGVICPKGNAGIMQLYDPDRVKKPLKRTNANRGLDVDPQWQEISWDQALDEIAAKLQILKDKDEANKLLWISEDHSFTHIQDDFCKLFGTPNYSMHSNLCDVARKASYKSVMGHDRPLTDFKHSKYILLFGWNPTSAIKWVYLPRILTQGIENGARLVVVDPYLSDTAAKGHEWLSIRPGTDGALALALGHVILRDGLEDKEFLSKWCSGVDEYKDYVKDKTPQWAEEITSISAHKIEHIAHELATTKPALVDSWSGPGQHTNGVQGGRAIAILNALIGSIDLSGGMIIPNAKGNAHNEIEPEESVEKTLKMPRFDELDKFPLGHKSGVYTQMFNNIVEEKGPYKPDTLFCVFQNPVMSLPGGTKTVTEAFKKLELSVVIDTMMSETALLADYVLPGTVYLERYDLNTHWTTWPVLGLRQPVVKPLFNQLAEYETVVALGRRLKLKDKEGKEFFHEGPLSGAPIDDLTKWYEEYLSKELINGAPKMSLEELKQLPGAVFVDKSGTKYKKYASEVNPDNLKKAFYDGNRNTNGTVVYDKPKEEKGKYIGVVVEGKVLKGFDTSTGKVELFKPSLTKKNDANGNSVNALPAYEPRDWQPNAEYPFYLINWKEASHTHTRTQNNAWLLDLKNKNPLVINTETAEKLGIADGDRVWVESPHGKIMAEAKVTKRIHPEVVGAQHGFGHTALGKQAKGKGSNMGVLNITKSDPLSGMAVHKEICVKIYKA
jgi:thiosulfate reductase/polysulfide reductase chain A